MVGNWGRVSEKAYGAEACLTYEVLEAVGPEMDVLHENKDPNFGVGDGLLQSRPDGSISLHADRVAEHAVVSKLPLLRGQPPRLQRRIGQREASSNGKHQCDGTLDDEEPAPALETHSPIETAEDARGDQAREGRGEDVARVEHADARGQLLAGVEDGQQVQGARVEGRLHDTEEEARQHHSDVVLGQCGERGHNGPADHEGAHPPRGADAGQDHVAGDLAEHVADEENGYSCVVLGALEAEVILEAVEAGEGDGCSIEVVEEVLSRSVSVGSAHWLDIP